MKFERPKKVASGIIPDWTPLHMQISKTEFVSKIKSYSSKIIVVDADAEKA